MNNNQANVLKCIRHTEIDTVSVIAPTAIPSESSVIVEPVAGTSGINGKSFGRKNSSPQRSYARKYNIEDSDEDYDSDETIKLTKEISQVLTAPDLQLDWASDSSEDVIFVVDEAQVINI